MTGAVEIHEVPAPSLEGNPLGDPARRKTPVYLPPGYASSTARFPVVYFLHGYSGSGMGWVNTTGFQPTPIERLDQLVAGGTIPPVIAVYCDGWTALGGSQWINSEAVGRYGDYLVGDVVGYADKTFRTLPKAAARALIGKSSGGYGAMAHARTHPDVFAHVACHSGDAYFEYCYLPDFPRAASAYRKAGGVEPWHREFIRRARETKTRGEDHTVINILAMAAAYSAKKGEPLGIELPFVVDTGRIKPEVWERWLVQDPVRFIPGSAEAFRKLESLFIDCGTRDEFNLQWGARLMVEALAAAGVKTVHEEFDDGHMGIYYRYDRSLSYLVPRLSR
jgi:S-formylglutathione hydrolase FrmB